jgi:hypothetical protein
MSAGAEEAARACRRLFGTEPTAVERIAGRRRASLRVEIGGRRAIATPRKHPGRARMEVAVLQALAPLTVAVPRIYGFASGWLFQEDLGGRRLSQALAASPPEARAAWLERALESLAGIQAAAARAGLAARLPRLGADPEWRARLAAMPARIGDRLDRPAPALDMDALVEALNPARFGFVKWDSRPGNAIAREDGTVAWFDWEHCGARDPLDDPAWLLGDEYVALDGAAEEELFEGAIARFAADRDPGEARAYLATYGALHATVRLSLVLKYKADGDWWDPAYCLERDKIGVTLDCALTLTGRAARWAARSPRLRPLAAWYAGLDDSLRAL